MSKKSEHLHNVLEENANRLKLEQNWITTISMVILAAIALAFALKIASSILIPFVLAIFIKQLVKPLLDYLICKVKMPRILAVISTFLILLVIFLLLCLFLTGTIGAVAGKAVEYSDKFVKMIDWFDAKMTSLDIQIQTDDITAQLKNKIPSIITSSFGTFFGSITNLFLVIIFLMFLLAGYNHGPEASGMYHDMGMQISKYISTKLTVSTATAILVGIVLALFKLDLAFFIAFAVFLLNFIPSLGSIIATFLPLPIALAQYENPYMIVLVILIPGAIQIVIGNVIEPKIMGKGLRLHPVTILLALSFWGLIWGVPGMFLAAPITAVIRIICEQFETLQPVSAIMGGKLPEKN